MSKRKDLFEEYYEFQKLSEEDFQSLAKKYSKDPEGLLSYMNTKGDDVKAALFVCKILNENPNGCDHIVSTFSRLFTDNKDIDMIYPLLKKYFDEDVAQLYIQLVWNTYHKSKMEKELSEMEHVVPLKEKFDAEWIQQQLKQYKMQNLQIGIYHIKDKNERLNTKASFFGNDSKPFLSIQGKLKKFFGLGNEVFLDDLVLYIIDSKNNIIYSNTFLADKNSSTIQKIRGIYGNRAAKTYYNYIVGRNANEANKLFERIREKNQGKAV